jgi:hypothetical protein
VTDVFFFFEKDKIAVRRPKMKTKTSRSRLASIMLMLALVTSIFAMPMSVAAEEESSIQMGAPIGALVPTVLEGNAADGYKNSPHPTGPDLGSSTRVGYGGYEWVVIGWDGNGVASKKDTATLLLSKDKDSDNQDVTQMPRCQYDDNSSNVYDTSTLRETINTAFAGFPVKEQSKTIVLPRTLYGGSDIYTIQLASSSISSESLAAMTNRITDASKYTYSYYGVDPASTFDWYAYDNFRKNNPENQKYTGSYYPDNVAGITLVEPQSLWPLSNAEVALLDPSIRKSANAWWLRSPGYRSDIAALAYNYGSVYAYGFGVGDTFAARPAFNLNLKSIFFTSAVDGKAGVANTTLTTASVPTDEKLKFTFIDKSLSLLTSITARTVKSEETVSIPYSGVTTGAGKFVSAVIEDEDGEALFYGQLVDLTSGSASGTAQFIVPDEDVLPEGDYTLRVFNEEINEENFSDFVSTPIDIPLTVNNNPEIIPQGTAKDDAVAVVGTIVGNGNTAIPQINIPQTSDGFLLIPLVVIAGVSFVTLLTLITVALRRRRRKV